MPYDFGRKNLYNNNMTNKSILNDVINYKNKDNIRFHMPGHAGKAIGAFFDSILPYDITELENTGNLYEPDKDSGVSASFETAKKLFGTSATIFSVSGATLALQTAITAVIRRSDSRIIVCDRRCHRSVINAFALTGTEPIWFFHGNNNIVHQLCEEYKPAAVIVTSPDYYGEMTDITALRAVIPGDIPLITDNSHGSHLAFYKDGFLHPYKQGSNLVVDSLHKTLPSMTGTALLHSDDTFNTAELLTAMKLFASSSPSYILMSSICACLDYTAKNREKFNVLYNNIVGVKKSLRNMYYRIAEYITEDPFRICIQDANAQKLYTYLADNGLVCEFADAENVILIPSLLNTDDDFNILLEMCKKFIPSPPLYRCKTTHIPIRAMSPRDAVFSPSERIHISKCIGRVAACPITPYPPGIPVIMPGEIADSEVAEILNKNKINYIDVII